MRKFTDTLEGLGALAECIQHRFPKLRILVAPKRQHIFSLLESLRGISDAGCRQYETRQTDADSGSADGKAHKATLLARRSERMI